MKHPNVDNAALPLISVIITAYNYGHTLARAVDSALAQAYPHLEVVVLDNASTDTTPLVLAEYASELRIRSIRHEKNLGMIANHNAGLRAARGEYFVFLSADDCLMPGFLRTAMAYYLAHPEIDVVYSALYLMDAQGRVQGLRSHEIPAGYDIARDELPWLLACNGFICLPTLLVRRGIYEQFGDFDEAVFGADYDLIMRWAQNGVQFGYVPEAFAAFRVHAAQQTGIANFSRTGRQFHDHVAIVKKFLQPENDERLRGFERRIGMQVERQLQLVENEGYLDDGTMALEAGNVFEHLAAMQQRNAQRAYTPRISVFVVPGSLPVLLEQSLASLLEQTHADWEAIVIEGPDFALGPWCEQLDRSGRIRSLSFVRPIAPAAALNTAMSLARGNTYAFLQAGTRFAPDHLHSLARAAQSREGLYVTPLTIDVIDAQRRVERFRQDFGESFGTPVLAVAPAITLDMLAFRRDILDHVFGFAENLAAAGAWDFALRATRTADFILVNGEVSRAAYVGYPHEFFAPGGVALAVNEIYARHDVADEILDERRRYVAALEALLGDPAAAMVSTTALVRSYSTIFATPFTRIAQPQELTLREFSGV